MLAKTSMFGAIIKVIVIILICNMFIVVLSPIAYITSLFVALFRRRKILKSYRQKMRNWQPLKNILTTATILSILGIYGGFFSNYYKLPRIENNNQLCSNIL